VHRIAAEEAERWSAVVMTAFAEGGPLAPEMAEAFRVFAGAPAACPYIAEIDGEIAGGACASFNGSVAVLYCDATLPQYRGRGGQTALIARRLADARAAGCVLAMACTLPGTASQRNYERAGFRIAYTKAMLVKDGT
jgi:GNAT superfamily N-acetyltransferase